MTDLERDLYTALRMFVYGPAPSNPDERLELAKAALERAEAALCDYCNERPAVGEFEDRDDSVGYIDLIACCAECAALLTGRRER